MCRTARSGYTILELMLVLALIIILGAVLVPTFSGFSGNTKQKATADGIRSRLSEGRAKAMEQGVPYRLSINSDKTRLRLAPDGPDWEGVAADNPPTMGSKVIEDIFDECTAELQADAEDARSPDAGGWMTVATISPGGGIRETRTVAVVVKQKEYRPIVIQIRGVTGHAKIVSGAGSQP